MKEVIVRVAISSALAFFGMSILGITGEWTFTVFFKRCAAIILVELAGAVLAVSI